MRVGGRDQQTCSRVAELPGTVVGLAAARLATRGGADQAADAHASTAM